MNTLAAAHRRCALLLAPLHPHDQRQLLAALPAEDGAAVRVLLDELCALNLPLDALSAQALQDDAAVSAEQLPGAPALDWNGLAERSSPAWTARALACLEGAEREFCLTSLEPSQREAIGPLLSRTPELPPALAQSLRRHLLSPAESY
ncbi:hypothetical protein VPH13_12360 [Stenotrophomonas pavanii]|uniref:hypothetical protein n=1 Tax=Stenotrophomonas pavanii TaxID=487698 RepID=UPI002DB608F7|nr:hypothetical protein [Stenotrophomonas pavanii]MEC4339508.1 hypothetical protein [Stenotrophomonas pavanii]